MNALACRGVLFLCLFMGTMSEAQSAHIYFSEPPAGRIGRANLDGAGQVTLLSGLPSSNLEEFSGRVQFRVVDPLGTPRTTGEGTLQATRVNVKAIQ